MEAETLQKSKEMTISKFMKDSGDEQKMTKRKRKKVDWFVFLPDDILLDILKRVPEVFLRYKAKYVCKRWFNIITNRILLDHASCILQNLQNLKTRLVDIREEEEGLQVKEQVLDIPHEGRIRSWCNELVLMSHHRTTNLFVYNVITKEVSYLPEYSGVGGVGLSFDRFKGIYKVAHMFIGRTIRCHVLTLIRDENHAITRTFSKRKKLEGPIMNERQCIWGDPPVTVQGRYLNWIIRPSQDLVSVDMVKEEIRLISLPGSSNDKDYCDYSLFVMGGFLALMHRVSWYKAEIWLLKDFDRVKWDKLQSISGIRFFKRDAGLIFKYPICGVINKRYIISKCLDGMYSYDLKSGVQKKLDIHIHYTEFLSDEQCVLHSLAPCFK